MNDQRWSTVVPRWAPDQIPIRQAIANAVRCPFDLSLNPNGPAAQRSSVRWLQQMYGDGVSEGNTARSRMSWIVAGFYPDADLRRLSIATDYISWAFRVDDLADETPAGHRPTELIEIFERYEGVFQGASISRRADPSVRALADIVERLARESTPEQLGAFFDANRAYFGAMLWEANNRAQKCVPDEAAFLLLRPAAGAVPPFLQLIEPLNSIRLPLRASRNESIQEMTRLAGRVTCWINDVLSYEKERKAGDVHNLAIVYEEHRNLRPGDALASAVSFANSEIDDFIYLADSLPSFGADLDVEVSRYVRTLQSMMRVTLDWTLGSTRYGLGSDDRLAGQA